MTRRFERRVLTSLRSIAACGGCTPVAQPLHDARASQGEYFNGLHE
jgi:hypothetical protein